MSSLSNTVVALGILGQYEIAAVLADEAYGLGDRLPPQFRNLVGCNLAWALVERARRERDAEAPAPQWQPRALRAVQVLGEHLRGDLPQVGSVGDDAYSWGNLTAALVLLDEHDRARALFARLQPMHVAAGDGHALLFIHRHLGWSHLQCGEWQQALVCAREHQALARSLGRRADEHRGLEIEARALEQAGRWQEALAAFKQFHTLHARHVLEQAEEKARALAVSMQTDRALRESQIDALTGLANRRAFDVALARAVDVSGGRTRSLLLIDVDHFKGINDRYGHAAGDEALRALASVLQRTCRDGDLPVRLGGDEFAVLADAAVHEAAQLAQRIARELRHWQPATAGLSSPTLSMGVAALAGRMTATDWLAAADGALYAAKAAGRDAVRVHGWPVDHGQASGAAELPRNPGAADREG